MNVDKYACIKIVAEAENIEFFFILLSRNLETNRLRFFNVVRTDEEISAASPHSRHVSKTSIVATRFAP